MKKNIKKISVSMLVLLVILAGASFLFRNGIKTHFTPVVEQVGGIDVHIRNDTCFLSAMFSADNRTFLRISIDTVSYSLSFLNKTYLRNKVFIGEVLHGHRTDTMNFSLSVPYEELLNDIRAEKKKNDSASYTINITVRYTTHLGTSELFIARSGKLKLPTPPDIEIVGIKYNKIRRHSIRARVKIRIINYNAKELHIKNLRYSMNVLDQGTINGSYKKEISILPGTTTYIEVPIEIDPKNITKTLFDILMNRDLYDYTLTLNALLESAGLSEETFHINLVKTGKMELKK
jgi:LEA14-like dessication related protein